MMYHLKWITKQCGIGTATAELVGMVWNGRYTFRQKNKIYRLKSARGRWHINRTRGTDEYARMWGTWEIMKDGTVIPRQTFRCLRTFSTLYLLDKARRGII